MFSRVAPFLLGLSSLLSSTTLALPVDNAPQSLSSREWREGAESGMQNLRETLYPRSEAGPVISSNFPDPGLIKVGNFWYAFATRTKGSTVHIQIASSTDFNKWTLATNSDGSQKDALPTLPAWVNNTGLMTWNTWAPDVQQLGTNSFVMYFAATTTQDTSGLYHCVGAATASSVEGPYTAQAKSLFCPLARGGAIDAAGFKDVSGQRYVVYKVDGNSRGNGGACGNTVPPIQPTPILLQKVAADGVTLQGSPTQLLDNNGVSDDGITEAPAITRSSSGTYVLFFSSGCFVSNDYTVSYATASSVTGPYTRASAPLFKTGTYGLSAPGSASIWTDAQHMVFHANNGPSGSRSMYTAQINISGNTVTA